VEGGEGEGGVVSKETTSLRVDRTKAGSFR
jgi:hypothetical protein